MYRLLTALLVIRLLAGLGGSVAAQEITGQIRGAVTDSSGAAVVNARVTVTNTGRNQVIRSPQTNAAGEYVAPLLPVGRYSVIIEAAGFKKFVQTDIVLNATDRHTVDATLQPGARQARPLKGSSTGNR